MIPASAAHSQNDATVFTRRDAALVGSATAGAAVLSQWDVPLARAFADSAFHARHPRVRSVAVAASQVTETALMLTGTAAYLYGRARRQRGTSDVSLHVTESVAGAAVFIQLVRGTVGRARPFVAGDEGDRRTPNAYDFGLLRGFTSFDYRSFPSMHAMASFAAATAVAQELRVRDVPSRRTVVPILYGAAAVPALARMYLAEHWASDIALGTFLGIYAGQKVVGYSHAHPSNRVDHFFLRATMSVSGSGMAVSVTPF